MNALQIAIQMETDAVAFYTEGASKTNNQLGKQMFLSIVEDEKRHITYVNNLIKGMDFKPEEITPMQKIETVFEQNKAAMMVKVAATEDEMEVFRIASQMERAGYDFYKKAAASAATPKEKALFERLADEESQHLKIFDNTFTYMKDSGSWFMWEERAIYEGG
jgi:rubrerythrin